MKFKKWFEPIFPSAVFFIVAAAEGKAFWVAGVAFIIWVFYSFIKDVIK